MITTIQNPRNPWNGRQVKILTSDQWGPNVVCKVEAADCPGLTTYVRRDDLAAWKNAPADTRP